MVKNVCSVCDHSQDDAIFSIKEMQIGLRESFNYFHCQHCGCMQIIHEPEDLAKYYPNSNYYSFTPEEKAAKPSRLRKWRTAYLLFGENKIPGFILSLGYTVPEYLTWVKNAYVRFDDRILDVGTGTGRLLKDLYRLGFSNVSGIDPFIDKDINYGNYSVKKKDIYDLDEQYDLIMLHHVFEHMNKPHEVLRQLYTLLKPGKFLIIRTPVMNAHGWATYGTNWVGLDAPRHLIIHSLKSMEICAERAGFEVKKIIFDSVAFHSWASRQYENDIPLMDERSYMVNPKASIFTKKQIREFKKKEDALNKTGESDQAAFYLYKPLI